MSVLQQKEKRDMKATRNAIEIERETYEGQPIYQLTKNTSNITNGISPHVTFGSA